MTILGPDSHHTDHEKLNSIHMESNAVISALSNFYNW